MYRAALLLCIAGIAMRAETLNAPLPPGARMDIIFSDASYEWHAANTWSGNAPLLPDQFRWDLLFTPPADETPLPGYDNSSRSWYLDTAFEYWLSSPDGSIMSPHSSTKAAASEFTQNGFAIPVAAIASVYSDVAPYLQQNEVVLHIVNTGRALTAIETDAGFQSYSGYGAGAPDDPPVITPAAIPEPATYLTALLAFGLLALRRARK